jgi:hypothetical protein
MRNFISIDFGDYTGCSLFREDKYQFSFSFKVLSEQSIMPIIIVDKFIEKSKDYFNLIDCFVIEDYVYDQRYFNTNQSEIIGCFKYRIYKEIRKPIYFINTKSARKILLGKGSATKSQIRKYIKSNIGMDLNNQHEYDSVLIGLSFIKMRDNLTESALRKSIIIE